MDQVVEDLLCCLDDPALALLQWNEAFGVVQVRCTLQNFVGVPGFALNGFTCRDISRDLTGPHHAISELHVGSCVMGLFLVLLARGLQRVGGQHGYSVGDRPALLSAAEAE